MVAQLHEKAMKYGLFACSAYLLNHESPRRGPGFVTQKAVQAGVRTPPGIGMTNEMIGMT